MLRVWTYIIYACTFRQCCVHRRSVLTARYCISTACLQGTNLFNLKQSTQYVWSLHRGVSFAGKKKCGGGGPVCNAAPPMTRMSGPWVVLGFHLHDFVLFERWSSFFMCAADHCALAESCTACIDSVLAFLRRQFVTIKTLSILWHADVQHNIMC